MIFIDASAIVAVLAGEPQSSELIDLLARVRPGECFASPLSVFEAALAMTRIRACEVDFAEREVRRFLDAAQIAVEPLDDGHAAAALQAFARFGKGRHRAALNLGDCFAYAAARSADASILFIGDDFIHTDLPSAL